MAPKPSSNGNSLGGRSLNTSKNAKNIQWSDSGPEMRGSISFSSSLNAPFALDFDPTLPVPESYDTTFTNGYRNGGPKEARLFRVALLKAEREVDHLHPVRLTNLPKKLAASPEKLKEALKEYGEVNDIYIPRNLRSGQCADFAVLRFEKKESQSKILQNLQEIGIEVDNHQLSVEKLRKQPVIFSKNTGALGISNEAYDDGSTKVIKKVVEQSISLSSCLSRSGYPWGSKQVLKLLEPHSDRDVMYMHSLKIENLNTATSSSALQKALAVYGDIGGIYFPKPLAVNLRTQDENLGFGFARFKDIRDLNVCLGDLQKGTMTLDGHVLRALHVNPITWPTEQTRRYY